MLYIQNIFTSFSESTLLLSFCYMATNRVKRRLSFIPICKEELQGKMCLGGAVGIILHFASLYVYLLA